MGRRHRPLSITHGQASAHLIKADETELPAKIDPRRADAEDPVLLQPVLSINGAHCHGCRQSRRHDHRHDIQGTKDELPRGNLLKHKPQRGKERQSLR